MKRFRFLVLILLSTFGVLVLSGSVFAHDRDWDRRGWGHGHGHHDHWHSSFYIGIPFYAGYPHYYDPYWDYPRYPRTIVIERNRPTDAGSGPPPAQYWYYCDSADAYYPYVEHCPEGWQEVPATPTDKQ